MIKQTIAALLLTTSIAHAVDADFTINEDPNVYWLCAGDGTSCPRPQTEVVTKINASTEDVAHAYFVASNSYSNINTSTIIRHSDGTYKRANNSSYTPNLGTLTKQTTYGAQHWSDQERTHQQANIYIDAQDATTLQSAKDYADENDADTQLTEQQVDDFVGNNGYLTEHQDISGKLNTETHLEDKNLQLELDKAQNDLIGANTANIAENRSTIGANTRDIAKLKADIQATYAGIAGNAALTSSLVNGSGLGIGIATHEGETAAALSYNHQIDERNYVNVGATSAGTVSAGYKLRF